MPFTTLKVLELLTIFLTFSSKNVKVFPRKPRALVHHRKNSWFGIKHFWHLEIPLGIAFSVNEWQALLFWKCPRNPHIIDISPTSSESPQSLDCCSRHLRKSQRSRHICFSRLLHQRYTWHSIKWYLFWSQRGNLKRHLEHTATITQYKKNIKIN